VVSACGVDPHAEKRNLHLLKIADKRRKAGSRLIVLGCLAGISASRLLDQLDAELVPPSKLDTLDAMIGAGVPIRQIADVNQIDADLRRARRCFGMWTRLKTQVAFSWGFRQKAAWALRRLAHLALQPVRGEPSFRLRIAAGCLGQCSYCGIRLATGSLRSKPLETVVQEFEAGLQHGFRKFELVANDSGAYGQDLGTNIVELLRRLFDRDDEFLLEMTDLNPRWVVQYGDQLAELWADRRHRVGRLLVPLQSGSEKILRLMHRCYTAADAQRHLLRLQAASPEIRLATHVIVGFPGETDEDFDDTERLLESLPLREIGVFEYGDRPGTEAAQLPEHVPADVVRKRIRGLMAKFPGTTRHFC
jgi:MiaB/RimO family radical SAM methylthiotransferase